MNLADVTEAEREVALMILQRASRTPRIAAVRGDYALLYGGHARFEAYSRSWASPRAPRWSAG